VGKKMTPEILISFIFLAFLSALTPMDSKVRRVTLLIFSAGFCLKFNINFFIAGLGLSLINIILAFAIRRFPVLNSNLIPLIYATILLVFKKVFALKIGGYSYLVLSASLDLALFINKGIGLSHWFLSWVNLTSFPKSSIGPIASLQNHETTTINLELASKWIVKGLVKIMIILPLFREYLKVDLFKLNIPILDTLLFGLWNYCNLYLEFSGYSSAVMGIFLLFGMNCPQNFDSPWKSFSIKDFWNRWHMSLGTWIKSFIYIPFGGNRAGNNRTYLNLILAMGLCGLWHGSSWNYLLWGLMQGIGLSLEKLLKIEEIYHHEKYRLIRYIATQTFVIFSWSLFFS
jgi:alginate O-acetyltransferase complex protein AlgI